MVAVVMVGISSDGDRGMVNGDLWGGDGSDDHQSASSVIVVLQSLVVIVAVVVIGTYYEGSDHHHCCRKGDSGSGTKVLSLSMVHGDRFGGCQ